ncbi:hypothetical protein WN55_07000 [Dufourea novaeangliae]|uniref:Uncharacterized protein n=1 Tax=Dufourea novaeangliae TaxID=178035 RepID=A0A154PR02_DUFNO|nr:hypothetical protein WN55_07000 [Dufourea novaeangliae]
MSCCYCWAERFEADEYLKRSIDCHVTTRRIHDQSHDCHGSHKTPASSAYTLSMYFYIAKRQNRGFDSSFCTILSTKTFGDPSSSPLP